MKRQLTPPRNRNEDEDENEETKDGVLDEQELVTVTKFVEEVRFTTDS